MFKIKSIAFTLMIGASLFSITSAYSMDPPKTDEEEKQVISRRVYDPPHGDVAYIRTYCYEHQMFPTQDYNPSLGDVETYLRNYCKPQSCPTRAHGPSSEEMNEFKRNYFYENQKKPTSLEVNAYKSQKTKEQQIANDEKFRAVQALRVQEKKKQLIKTPEIPTAPMKIEEANKITVEKATKIISLGLSTINDPKTDILSTRIAYGDILDTIEKLNPEERNNFKVVNRFALLELAKSYEESANITKDPTYEYRHIRNAALYYSKGYSTYSIYCDPANKVRELAKRFILQFPEYEVSGTFTPLAIRIGELESLISGGRAEENFKKIYADMLRLSGE